PPPRPVSARPDSPSLSSSREAGRPSSAHQNFFEDFDGKLDIPELSLMLNPRPELRYLVDWVIGIACGNQDVRIEQVGHLSHASHHSRKEQGLDISRLNAQHPTCLRICDIPFIKGSPHQPEQRRADAMPANDVVAWSAFGSYVPFRLRLP